MERTSAKLSKLPSAVSSPGNCEATSRLFGSRPNKSRMALAVLGPVQAMHGADASGIGIGCPRSIQGALQLRGRFSVDRRFWTRPAGGRHRSRAQLLDHGLPYLRMLARVAAVETIQREPASPQPFVMTTDAVLRDERVRGEPTKRTRRRERAVPGAQTHRRRAAQTRLRKQMR